MGLSATMKLLFFLSSLALAFALGSNLEALSRVKATVGVLDEIQFTSEEELESWLDSIQESARQNFEETQSLLETSEVVEAPDSTEALCTEPTACSIQTGTYATQAAAPVDRLWITSYNIGLNGRGDAKGQGLIGVLNAIRNLGTASARPLPDVLLLQKVARGCSQYEGVNGAEAIARALQYHFAYTPTNVLISDDEECTVGNAIVSRYPLTNLVRLVHRNQVADETGARVSLGADVQVSADVSVNVWSAQLESAVADNVAEATETQTIRTQQAVELALAALKSTATSKVLGGGLGFPLRNTDPTSMALQQNKFYDGHRGLPERTTVPSASAQGGFRTTDYIFSLDDKLLLPSICAAVVCQATSHLPISGAINLPIAPRTAVATTAAPDSNVCLGVAGACDLRFNQITLPGSHNSGAYDLKPDFSQSKAWGAIANLLTSSCLFQNHVDSIARQLAGGIRMFDVDICTQDNGNKFVTCHGTSDLTGYGAEVAGLLRDMKTFLQQPANKNEVVAFYFGDKYGDNVKFANHIYNTVKSVIGFCNNDDPNDVCALTLSPNATQWPTIRQMIASKQRIVVFVRDIFKTLIDQLFPADTDRFINWQRVAEYSWGDRRFSPNMLRDANQDWCTRKSTVPATTTGLPILYHIDWFLAINIPDTYKLDSVDPVCGADEESWGLLCYPKCKTGYYSFGCCVCKEEDSGWNIFTSTYGRGVGHVQQCPASTTRSLGLCYPACRDSYQRSLGFCVRTIKCLADMAPTINGDFMTNFLKSCAATGVHIHGVRLDFSVQSGVVEVVRQMNAQNVKKYLKK
eukprot:TRINITY_DN123_c0_g1_i4.p1 TRINITY_DN123_c0_g1~~TRINITY_DN123_c0_g1_i4.p1  ORF type:complete len:806 (-),score=320.46 TRINITY_DN123_c0_g1_i4:110-2527(-)